LDNQSLNNNATAIINPRVVNNNSDQLLNDSLDDPYIAAPVSPPQLQPATSRPHFKFENKRQVQVPSTLVPSTLVPSARISNISPQSLLATTAMSVLPTTPINMPPVYQRQKKSQK
jgi:hypothetical protein